MRKMRFYVWLLLVGLAFTSSLASAQEQTYTYTFQVVKAPQNPGKKLLSTSEWQSFLKRPGCMVLEDVGAVSSGDAQSLSMGGTKNPFGYTDTRAAGSQVQYVDLGAKIDATIKPRSDGTLFVDARGERSTLNPHPQAKERASCAIFESGTVMKRGQVAVFVCARGPLIAKLFKFDAQGMGLSSSDWLVLALSIE